MNTTEASGSTRFKVGLFTLTGLLFIGILTVYVNDRPYWYRPCQLVRINVDDATGLKAKSPVRSLGLEIGYLRTVELAETHVTLGICITAPVEILPTTRAYLRGEGFLGDKFVELKPVRYLGGTIKAVGAPPHVTFSIIVAHALSEGLFQPVHAQPKPEAREIPVGSQTQDVQQLVTRVDELVEQMTDLTTNLKTSIDPTQLKETMKQLNQTLENASKTLSPQGGLTQTAQRTLAKLEDSIEQLRALMTRVNQGEGSVGMLLNDPAYADEIRDAIKNVNALVGGARKTRFFLDVGAEQFSNYEDGRGWFQLGIWPKHNRYYLLGVSVDPRGRRTETIRTTTTTVEGLPPQVNQTREVQHERTGLLLTAMVGHVWWDRVDLSIGSLYGDGAITALFNLGPKGNETLFQLRNDIYSGGSKLNARSSAIVRPWGALYFKAGIESYRKIEGENSYLMGAGVRFEDEDIKLLFALR